MSYDDLFDNLRQKLDVLGYHQPLPLAAVPLAGALFEDLVKTTESLRDAKLQLSNLLEEKSCWELGVEPYKCDNSRLLAECNTLHLELIKQRDTFDEQICDYAKKIRSLESDKRCLEDHCIELESQIRDLNLRYTDTRSTKSKKDGVNMSKKPFITTVRTGVLLPAPLLEQGPHPSKCAKCNSILWTKHPNGGTNNNDIERLQNDVREKADQAALYKKKVEERDREIRRLNDLLSGGRPSPALAKDCCYKNVGTLSEDVEKLQKEKVENCHMIRELQQSMHEAKQRAVDLAERNKKIERELKELKDAALSVEQQANEEIAKKENEISRLCDEIRKLKRQQADSNERRPDRSADEKRRLNERLNEMIHREKELEAEIDRMSVKNCKLQSKLAALEKENDEKHHREDKSVSTEVDEERIRLKSERDLFQKEYLRLVEKSASSQEVCALSTQLKEKEDELANLRSELYHLRSQTVQSSHNKTTPPSTSISVQAAIIRAERERDIVSAELDRVKAERDILREKLQYSADAQLTETDRFRREIQELNVRICQLEQENRELLSSQVPGQTHIILLKEEMEELKKRLCEVQNENCQLNTRHNQLKLLHEQTERALVDYQNKHAISEANLRNAESRLGAFATNRDTTRSEVCLLQNEISVLKSANATLEGEKDKILNDLDKKTEVLYRAENELKLLKKKKEELEYTVQSLETRLDKVTSERRVRESELHETSTESKTLRQQINTLKEIRDQTITENGRLSNELADAKADNSLTKKKLKESEKEVDHLKQQLQSYVQKVQRAEDLLMQKEREREEMLDHYRTLSHDAIMLEGNNQSLEMEAAEHKRQLLDAEEEIARLKQEITIKDCTIEKLEKQVSCLSAQICSLEKDLEQSYDDQKLLKADLDAIKELCEKLDLQSEKQNAELQERGEIISKLEKENSELRNGSHPSPKGKAAIDILQDLLAKSRQELEEERKALCKLALEKLDLRKTIEEMQKNLDTERAKSAQKEALAKEYSVQIQEMHHNLTDDRFQKARSREETPSYQKSKRSGGSKTYRLSSGCDRYYYCHPCGSRNCSNHPGNESRSNYSSNYNSNMCPNYDIYCRKSSCSPCTCPSVSNKSKTSSLKSMKSVLESIDPCKRSSLIEDVNSYLGGRSRKYDERISFDEDSDDIIVRRKRCVETKKVKGDKKLTLEDCKKLYHVKRNEDKKNDSSDSLRSFYFCCAKPSSKDKTKEKPKSERTESSKSKTRNSKDEKRQSSSSNNKTIESSNSSARYAEDPQIEKVCRHICEVATSCPSPMPNEIMCIKKYDRKDPSISKKIIEDSRMKVKKALEKCAVESKPEENKVEEKKDKSASKEKDKSASKEKDKSASKEKDESASKERKSTEKSNSSNEEKSVQSNLSKEDQPIPEKNLSNIEKLTEEGKSSDLIEEDIFELAEMGSFPVEKVPSSKESVKSKTDENSIKDTSKDPPSSKNSETKNDCSKPAADAVQDFCKEFNKLIENEKDCPELIELKFKVNKMCIGDTPKESFASIKSSKTESACGKETKALVKEFCKTVKKAIEKEKDCLSVIALKDKIDAICAIQTSKDSVVSVKTAESDACGIETKDAVQTFCSKIKELIKKEEDCPAIIDLKKRITKICSEDKLSDIMKKESGVSPRKSKSSTPVIKKESKLGASLHSSKSVENTTKNTKETEKKNNRERKLKSPKASDPPPIKREKAKQPAKVKSDFNEKKTKSSSSTKMETKKGSKNDIQKKEESNDKKDCSQDTKAFVKNFCEGVKKTISREKDCPSVIVLKEKIDQICINDTQELTDSNTDNESQSCGLEAAALAQDFCTNINNLIEKEKDCPTVIELKKYVHEFCKGTTNDGSVSKVSIMDNAGDDQKLETHACANLSFPPTFEGCECMKPKFDRIVSILKKGCATKSFNGSTYYRHAIICRRSNNRLEQTVVERGFDGSNVDLSQLPSPPILDRSKIYKETK